MRRWVIIVAMTVALVCTAEVVARLALWRYNNPYEAILQPQYQIFKGVTERGTEGDFAPQERSIWVS